jgi:hypothetical protein
MTELLIQQLFERPEPDMTAGPNRDAGSDWSQIASGMAVAETSLNSPRRTELAMIGARLRGDVRIVLWNGPPLLPAS